MDPRHPQIYYAAKSPHTMIKSEDGGATWRTVAEGLTARVNALIIDPSQPERLLAGTESGVFRSEDGGEHWARAGLDGANVRILISSLEHPHVVYASLGYTVLYKSEDGGVSWVRLTDPPGRWVRDLAVDPTDPDILYAATFANGLVKSEDGGGTWTQLSLDGEIMQAVALHPQHPERVVAMDGEGRVWASRDGGETWQSLGMLYVRWLEGLIIAPAAEDAPYEQAIYIASQEAGVYRYDYAWSLHLPRLIH